MKKIISILLVFVMLFLMVGCDNFSLTGGNSTTTTEPDTLGETVTDTFEDVSTQSNTTAENTTMPEKTSTETTTEEITTNKATTTKADKSNTTTTTTTTTTTATTTKAETTTIASNITLTGNIEIHFSNEMSKIINDEFLRLVNEERKNYGVQPLAINNALMSAAKTRSIEAVQYYSHTRPDGTKFSTVLDESKHYYYYATTGENLGRIYYSDYTNSDLEMNYTNEQLKDIAKTFFDGWKNSQEHYENMVSQSFNETGFYFIKYYNKETTEYGIIGTHLFGSQ